MKHVPSFVKCKVERMLNAADPLHASIVNAVKYVRSTTGCSLKEAAEFVVSIRAVLVVSKPTLKASKASTVTERPTGMSDAEAEFRGLK